MDVRTWQGRSRSPDPGRRRICAAGWTWGLAAALVAVTGAAGLFLLLAPPSYRAEAQVLIGTRSFGLVGLRAQAVSADHEATALAVTKGQAQLVASRDLARRAIEDLGIDSWPEFDSVTGARGPASHLLVLLGLKRDPSRMSRPERILQAYEDRLSVSAEPKSRRITIAFESEDRDLAARAANRIADLYLEMRAETKDRMLGIPEARVVSRAVSARSPAFPQAGWAMALGLSATFATAFGTLVARRRGRHARAEAPVEQPRPLGPTRMLARPDATGRTSPPPSGLQGRGAAEARGSVAAVVERIAAARRGASGAIVLVTSCRELRDIARFTLDLARRLGQESRAILVGLDSHQRLDLAPRTPEHSTRIRQSRPAGACLADLVEGRVSFAEVIGRDPGSRLHYLDATSDGRLDLTGSESVFAALAETYDFVVLVAPPLDHDDAAMSLAAAADVVVLATPPQANDLDTGHAEAALLGRGARTVEIVGLPSRLRQCVATSLGRDAA
jgi:capsular polysaccharide biosynthesis protein/Mrp family chromosome partitioning ATPase